MTLRVRQMAWLHAKPEKKKESRGQEFKRLYGDECPELDLPDVGNAEHVIGYLFEVGPAVRGEELTHGDLWHYQQNTGAVLCEWEASMMVLLSREYLAMLRKASEKACPAPWRRERTNEEKAERARQQIEARKARSKMQQQRK